MSDVASAILQTQAAPQSAVTESQTSSPTVTEPQDKMASKFAALTRKEKEIREREKSWAQQKAEQESAIEAARNKFKPYEELEEKIKVDKKSGLKFLFEKGYTAEEISDMLLDELNPSDEVKLKRTTSELERNFEAKLKALEDKLAAKEAEELEKSKKYEEENYNKTITTIKTELKDFVDKSDDYDLIKLNDAYDTVFEVMQEHYAAQVKSGTQPQNVKLLTYEEAAKWTEAYLEEDVNKKYEAKKAKQAPRKSEERKTTSTLSNTMSAEVPNSGERKLSVEESKARAASMLRFIED